MFFFSGACSLETNGLRIDKNTKTNTVTTGMDYNWAGVIWKCGEINATRSMLWKMIRVLSVDFTFPYIIEVSTLSSSFFFSAAEKAS